MKQSELPKFVSVQFYPGYTYDYTSNEKRASSGRYVALGTDGRVYGYALDGKDVWICIGFE